VLSARAGSRGPAPRTRSRIAGIGGDAQARQGAVNEPVLVQRRDLLREGPGIAEKPFLNPHVVHSVSFSSLARRVRASASMTTAGPLNSRLIGQEPGPAAAAGTGSGRAPGAGSCPAAREAYAGAGAVTPRSRLLRAQGRP